MNEQHLSYIQAIRWGIATFFNNLGIFFNLLLFWATVYLAIAACLGAAGLAIFWVCYMFMGWSAAVKTIVGIGVPILVPLFFYAYYYYLASLITASFKIYDHEQVTIRDAVPSLKKYNQFFKVMLVWTFFCLLAFCLFIIPPMLFAFYAGVRGPLLFGYIPFGAPLAIPGIIFFLFTCFIDLLAIDKNLSFREGFAVNRTLIYGHKISYFIFIVLALSVNSLLLSLITNFFAFVGISAALTFPIITLLKFSTTVIILLARIFLYKQITSNQECLESNRIN